MKTKKKYLIIISLVVFFIILKIGSPYIMQIQERMKIVKYGIPIAEDGTINNEYFSINSKGEKATENGINKAIEYASKNNIKYIKLEKGTYLVDGQSSINANDTEEKKGIILQSNITMDLNGSTLKQIANNKVNYAILTITGVENIEVKNGIIKGDKDEHDYTFNSTHEWGYGIDIRGSKNIIIENLEIAECTGDGVFITDYKLHSVRSENIVINNLNIHNCRRQGISIIDGKEISVENNEIYNIKGTNPQSGIDMESWASEQVIDNVYIRNNKIYNTKNDYSIIVMGNSRNVYIQKNEIYGKLACDNIKEKLVIEENFIKNGTVSFLVTNSDMEIGKIIKKIIMRNNNLENSNLYMMNVEKALIENNQIKNKGVMIFDSTVCFCYNTITNTEDTNMLTGIYSRLNNPIVGKEYNLFLYQNQYNGKINKQEDIEENEKMNIYREQEKIIEYKKEFE